MECYNYNLYEGYSTNPLYPRVYSSEDVGYGNEKYLPEFLRDLIDNCLFDGARFELAINDWVEFINELKSEWNLYGGERGILFFIRHLHLKYIYDSPYHASESAENSFNAFLDLNKNRAHKGSHCFDSALFLYICAEIVSPGCIQIAHGLGHAQLAFKNPDGTLWLFETTIRRPHHEKFVIWRPYSSLQKGDNRLKITANFEDVNFLHLKEKYENFLSSPASSLHKEHDILRRFQNLNPFLLQLRIEWVYDMARRCFEKHQMAEALENLNKVIVLSHGDIFQNEFKGYTFNLAKKVHDFYVRQANDAYAICYPEELRTNVLEAQRIMRTCAQGGSSAAVNELAKAE